MKAGVRKSKSPAMRWTSEHGNKKRYRIRLAAWLRRRQVDSRRGTRSYVYPCNWGADYRNGETAPTHYHFGRRATCAKGTQPQ